ncbi:MAG: geranyl transferase [Epulopiscium sp. Nuni2H_MBin003]|nr:MAG: geranyl transferase [Epulopiscium sp. Nuni2H_MBin003]
MEVEMYKDYIEKQLDRYLPQEDTRLNQAMRYSTLQGGKRIRPYLMELAYKVVGGTGDISAYMCAIEFIHTYSLIHDDLPAMDNDDLRRGVPTSHIKFDEPTAILAGDALLTLAFQIMLEDCVNADDIAKTKAMHLLSEGALQMVQGQMLDVTNEGKEIDIQLLDTIHLNKTGALIKATIKAGAVLGYASDMELFALETYGIYLGKVFQIIDDILDVTSTTQILGKNVGSDIKNNKITYLSFYSLEECYKIANELTNKALNSLDKIQTDTTLLRKIAQDLVIRKN